MRRLYAVIESIHLLQVSTLKSTDGHINVVVISEHMSSVHDAFLLLLLGPMTTEDAILGEECGTCQQERIRRNRLMGNEESSSASCSAYIREKERERETERM